jgi:hypothetical protein
VILGMWWRLRRGRLGGSSSGLCAFECECFFGASEVFEQVVGEFLDHVAGRLATPTGCWRVWRHARFDGVLAGFAECRLQVEHGLLDPAERTRPRERNT